MKQINAQKFEKLLEERRKMSKDKQKTNKKVSASDSQLSDIIKNFNESKIYKKL